MAKTEMIQKVLLQIRYSGISLKSMFNENKIYPKWGL